MSFTCTRAYFLLFLFDQGGIPLAGYASHTRKEVMRLSADRIDFIREQIEEKVLHFPEMQRYSPIHCMTSLVKGNTSSSGAGSSP